MQRWGARRGWPAELNAVCARSPRRCGWDCDRLEIGRSTNRECQIQHRWARTAMAATTTMLGDPQESPLTCLHDAYNLAPPPPTDPRRQTGHDDLAPLDDCKCARLPDVFPLASADMIRYDEIDTNLEDTSALSGVTCQSASSRISCCSKLPMGVPILWV